MMTEPEIDALLHVTNSPRYIAGMLSVSHRADDHDASRMRALMSTSRDYEGRLDALAFGGMTGHEVYEASGRAERDRVEIAFRKRLPTVQQQGDSSDYFRMRKLTTHQWFWLNAERAEGLIAVAARLFA